LASRLLSLGHLFGDVLTDGYRRFRVVFCGLVGHGEFVVVVGAGSARVFFVVLSADIEQPRLVVP